MSKGIFSLLALVLFGLTTISCGDVGDAPEANTGNAVDVARSTGSIYIIDTSKSSIKWKAAKVTRAHDGGFSEFDGTITVDGENVTGVKITIHTASIWSDTEKLTGHLKGDDFFAVKDYPIAIFEASQLTSVDTAGATHKVTGNLTMHGVTKSVTFPVTIQIGDGTVRATADFIINRQDWQISYTGASDDLVTDDVRLILDITAMTQGTTTLK